MAAKIINLFEFDELAHEELERQIAIENMMSCVCWQLTDVSNDNEVKMQSRKMSLLESVVNVAAGFLVALAVQIVVFPMFGLNVPLHDNLAISAIFTAVSLVRSYALRRLFNYIGGRS